MPELPEVEVVRKTLAPLLVDSKIVNVKIFLNKIIKDPDVLKFKSKILNQTFREVRRKAKLLIFVLDDDVLLSHLRMEGKYYYKKASESIDWKHVLIVFDLDNGYQLCYHDTRRFGTFHLQAKEKYQDSKPYINIGPEPWDELVTTNYLKNKWKNKKQKVKTALLDQSTISGLGNIYVDETLFAAKIHPETIVSNLNEQELESIIKNAIKILELSVQLGGSTIATYTSSLGVSGTFQNHLQVHTRANQTCFVCLNKIQKIKVNNRGTYFCAHCQIKK
ncbi:DNA-formamidopyrimidine glycosylase [Spiroplasma platyhelix]|uniref:Formamidopyrimidine-DNA glycosylase n=1 Tax=Spiroplasma platyhelix PALS-1 TaxID=1276218 RepID=A0A846TQ58_9MOLU|nr:DNA-formamidopyrimidine glycosylase [Spiroplasma platyhelix]MBE4704070.1 Formamidopyrimidine-DNA glycosylase [Spiroplasma platyhelix PALS-1]NKE38440.1 DNA-formamidopyrimidine glycosylase [Spiroplasma platyhelix PALS-1]UJB29328.1 formamidopyrimidine-DNA glycosylase [Spiroplasma platyhelix PALS-1]